MFYNKVWHNLLILISFICVLLYAAQSAGWTQTTFTDRSNSIVCIICQQCQSPVKV